MAKTTLLHSNLRRKSVSPLTAFCALACLSATFPLTARADQPAKSTKPVPQKSQSKPASKAAAATQTPTRSGAVDRNGMADRNGMIDRGVPAGLPSRGVHITRTAQQFKGLPYVWGGTSPKSGFDCSGLVQYVYAKWGIYLPRCASEQVNKGVPVKPDQLQAGDLVFFKNTYKQGLSHVGIYVGDGWFIHASSHKTGVILSRLDTEYRKKHWYGARRMDLSKLPPVEGEEKLTARVILEEPATGDPLPSPNDAASEANR